MQIHLRVFCCVLAAFREDSAGRSACTCPQPCYDVLYDIKVTYAAFPNTFYMDAITKLAAAIPPGPTKAALQTHSKAM